MGVFFTSDQHVGHKMVARIRWNRAHPGIETPSDEHVVKWHNSLLKQNWESVVAKDDVVWNLGDLTVSGTKTAVDFALGWTASLPGQKYFIPGNHDPVHPCHRDSHKWQKTYLAYAFNSVQMAARRRITLSDGEKDDVVLSHFPYFGDREEDREVQWRLRNEGSWLLHGHLHSEVPTSPERPRMIDVGVDAWNMTPVSLEQICELIEHERTAV